MSLTPSDIQLFDSTNPESIFEYSSKLIGQSLHSLYGDEVVSHKRSGKGGLGQMLEEIFFGYAVNSNPQADFSKAGVELKCTPLRKSKDDEYIIKERLICTMIDYFELIDTPFEQSHLIEKCRIMLLMFYLYIRGKAIYDYEFVFRVLWQLPEKDLILIRQDYETIAAKVRRGEAHLLSEGDTIYLGACRKGQKGDKPQAQPCSDVRANKRAFSLKPAYMRYVLSHVVNSETNAYSNYISPQQGKRTAETSKFELVSAADLATRTFEQIIINRFAPYIGKDYIEICRQLGIEAYQAKSKYADVAGLIASCGASKRISQSDEFVKSGIMMKTVRLEPSGMPKESMSFKNIDYCEVYDNDDWLESEAYEIFTSRFLFVVFKPVEGGCIKLRNNARQTDIEEQAYVLQTVFFWTMPSADLETAHEYWQSIREAVVANRIHPDAFWHLGDKRKFHVRPKAQRHEQKAVNPHGGVCDKYCYWLNADYIKTIIEENSKQ